MEFLWKNYTSGQNDIHYDHSILDTQFGRFLITWKGWKENPSYDVDESPFAFNFYPIAGSLLEVQKRCEKEFQRVISEINNGALGGPRANSEPE